jgi:hypothetical protein
MPYYPAPAERPRQAKRFLTAREVEDMAAGGRTEIVHLDDMVITDAARDAADDLGMRIVKPDSKPSTPPAPRVGASSAPQTPAPLAVAAAAPAVRQLNTAVPVPRSGAGDPLVQALVQAVRATKG